jgi:UrcA family protein
MEKRKSFNPSIKETIMVRKIAAVFLSITTGALLANGAIAAPAGERIDFGPSVTVRYSPADLATPRGAEVLYARLRLAANQVCPGADARDLMRAAPAKACYEAALAAAVLHVQQPRLTALHKRKTARAITASPGA